MHGVEDACIWTCAIRIAACTLYKVAVVKGFHRVKYIIYPFWWMAVRLCYWLCYSGTYGSHT